VHTQKHEHTSLKNVDIYTALHTLLHTLSHMYEQEVRALAKKWSH
jgi:hypothetical protein